MFDIFEQPWTLLAIAVLELLVVLILRSFFPQKYNRRQFVAVFVLVVAAFAFDFFIKTDLEKINILIKTGIKAVEEEDVNPIATLISSAYKDSVHKSKDDFVNVCRVLLEKPLIEKNKIMSKQISVTAPNAEVTIAVVSHFDKTSSYFQDLAQPFIITKAKLNLRKNAQKAWQVERAEILEINKQQINWGNVN